MGFYRGDERIARNWYVCSARRPALGSSTKMKVIIINRVPTITSFAISKFRESLLLVPELDHTTRITLGTVSPGRYCRNYAYQEDRAQVLPNVI